MIRGASLFKRYTERERDTAGRTPRTGTRMTKPNHTRKHHMTRRPFTTEWDTTPIGRILASANLSLADAAKATGYRVVTVRAVCLGTRRLTLDMLLRIQDATGASSVDMLAAARQSRTS